MDGCVSASRVAATVFLLCAGVAACGGGGGGGTPPTTSPTTVPTASTTPANPIGSGTLIDHETGLPIAGMYVGLAPYTAGATPAAMPTTNASGQFSVVASSSGTYLLVIGDGTNNRPVIHDLVTLNAGPNTLTAPNIGPAPGATPNTIEHSGNFRLTTLTSAEQACLALENTTRAQHHLSAVVSDEWLTEDNRGYWTVATATNSAPQYPGILVNYNASDGFGADCTDMIGTGFALNAWEANSQLTWFAGDSGGPNRVATSEGMVDPRATPYPTPSPNNPWP